MDTLLHNLRYGLRGLWRERVFTAVAVLTLALGIGANASIYGFLDAVVLNPFDLPAPERLVVLVERTPDSEGMPLTTATWLDVEREQAQFEHVGAWRRWEANLTGQGEAEQVLGHRVSPALFAALGVPALHGRTLVAGEDAPDQEDVVVLSYGLWQRRFGGDIALLGRTLTLDGRPHTVVGVMPADFGFPRGAQLYAPLRFSAEEKTQRGMHYLYAAGRLKPGATHAQAAASLQPLLAGQYPDEGADHRLGLVPLREFGDPLMRRMMWVMMAAVGLVLLAACANVASMLLARAARREKELAIRSALGAGRGRLVAQLLTESLLLALLGGGVGLLICLWGMDLMRAGLPQTPPSWGSGWERAGLNGRMLLFTLGTVTLATVLVGLVPALRASRTDPSATLRMEGRASAGSRERHRLRQALVAVQMAFALVLTVGACLNVRSFWGLTSAHPGFERQGVLTFRVVGDPSNFPQPADFMRFQEALVERLRALPGVQEVGAVNNLPMGRSAASLVPYAEGQPPQTGHEREAHLQVVTPGYFGALRIPLLEGEPFTGRERQEGPQVVLLSASLARKLYGEASPVGRRIVLGVRDGQEDLRTVVGVVGDVQQKQPMESFSFREAVYMPYTQQPWARMSFTVRTGAEPMLLAAAARRELAALDADVPATDIKPLERVVHEALTGPRYVVVLLVLFAAIALVLGAVGLYGVLAYGVSQRAREIGIRMALGAQPRDVVRLVAGQALGPAVAGVGVGLVGAWALAGAMKGFLVGVNVLDPLAFSAMPALLLAVAALATLGPVRAAIRVDPAVSFRSE